MKIKIEYFTDPICIYCYLIEPVLQRLVLEHGDKFELSYHYGGLLRSWEGFADPANGINGPEDVAEHWEHAGKRSNLPVSGNVWRNDPINSSYPASIACFAIRAIDESKEGLFLENLRKKAIVESKNVAKENVLVEVAESVGIEKEIFIAELNSDRAKQAFENDLIYTRERGVHSFPTMLVYKGNKVLKVAGFLPYEKYVQALGIS